MHTGIPEKLLGIDRFLPGVGVLENGKNTSEANE